MTGGKKAAAAELDEVREAMLGQLARFAQISETEGSGYLQSRIDCYSMRWREALVYADAGKRILDIGGGWVPEGVLDELILRRKHDYHYVDIFDSTVEATQAELEKRGLPRTNAKVSTNTALPYDDETFDFIFSSHCLEHSTDLAATFRELRRTLKRDGVLFYSVPFGFDTSDEHVYFLGVSEWVLATERAGFDVINRHIGRIYSPISWDLSIVAKWREQIDENACDDLVRKYCKHGRRFLRHDDAAIAYSKDFERQELATVVWGDGEAFQIADGAEAVIVFKHPWAAALTIAGPSGSVVVDAYDEIHQPSAIYTGEFGAPLICRVIGASQHSNSVQVAVAGLLVRA